ncbi:MAG: PAS domain S-box protein [Candidatus Aegiribacteria sp.]|nr:PAS domain S-box protein [Candidatus Aegiribacteria sp.]
MNDSGSVLSYMSIDNVLLDSDELTLFISRTGTIILVNSRGSEILGSPTEEITSKNWFEDFISDESREHAFDKFRSGLNNPETPVFNQDYLVLCSGEIEKRVSLCNRVVKDEDGIVMCILVSGHLIDESAESTDAIERNKDLYRSVIENSNDSIIVYKDGIIIFVNDTAKRVTGYLEEEFYGSNILDFISTDFKPVMLEYMNDRIAGKNSPSLYDIEILRKDGDIIPAEISVSTIQFEGEQAHLAILRDLSNRHALEGQLRNAQKMEAVGQLAGGVAHDFNNILQVINGYTELAQTSLEEGNPVKEMLQQVEQAGERANSLVSQLLTFSRNQQVVTRVLDLNEIITEHISLLQRVIGEDIELEFLASSETIYINGDQEMIGQILLNIFLNARDAMPDGGKILVKTKRAFLDREFCKANSSNDQGYYAMLSISDTGCGMDKGTLSRIFEPFFSTKGITAGTGLGLSTVYGIVSQHDGIITAKSKPENGSIFQIYLPLVKKEAIIEELLPEHEITLETSRTIVITEDDESVRNLVSDVLSDAGHEVITAVNGEDAVILLNDSPDSVDLVILDVIMPVLGGYEAADRIREIRPDIPLIFCSGSKEVQNQEDTSKRPERSRFLSKPYSMAQLLSAINELFAEIK